mgnify:CR=1 FL=1
MREEEDVGLLVGAVALLWSLALTPVRQRDHGGGATAGRHQHASRRDSRLCSAPHSVPATPSLLTRWAPCQWDMRAIGATSAGSYAVNLGRGRASVTWTRASTSRTTDIMPNVDVAASCVFIYADTPTSIPAEQVTRGDCSNKAALQDLAGHGTHTAGTIAAPINGIGIVGRRPEATIVVLKAGTANGLLLHAVGRRRAQVRG